jgi:hypothetical protein
MTTRTAADLEASLALDQPPPGLTPLLMALWRARTGAWAEAHAIAQDQDDSDGAWVHAYLHRVEGDLGNAGYWYRRAGKPIASGDVEAEWRAIAEALLARPAQTAS